MLTGMQARIVIELAPGWRERDALQAAAALAGSMDAELVGLFVEDAELLRFAALPFALEIGFASAQRRRLDVTEVERSLRAHAAEAERTLASTAERSAIRWSFRVARGVAARELLVAAMGAATEEATRDLRLLLLGDGGSAATRWAEQAREQLGRSGEDDDDAMRVSLVHAADLAELAAALQHDLPGVVVLLGDEDVLARRDLQALLREAAAPVLVLPRQATRSRMNPVSGRRS